MTARAGEIHMILQRPILIAAVACLALSLPALAAAQTTAGPLDSLRWEHLDSDVTTTQVNRFLVCYDGAADAACLVAPLTSKFTPTTAQGGPPAAGNSAYKLLVPALTAGQHTVTVKACNATVCGVPATPLTFSFQITPGTPTGVGFIKG